MKKIKNILLLSLWIFFSCQSPSEPSASLVDMIHVEYTYNDALSIGKGILEGHKYLLEMHHDLDDILDHFEWTHLQGDPTASIR